MIRLSELAAATVRIPLAITGTWARDGSRFAITLADLEAIRKNFERRRNGEINVDYDHASEMPEVAAGGPIPSAGRIVKLDAPGAFRSGSGEWGVGSGEEQNSTPNSLLPTPHAPRYILYGVYEPTDRARDMIQNREYRYISPAIDWGARSKQTGRAQGATLTSVALTNRPFLEELPQIRLSDPAYRLVDVGEVHVDGSLGAGGTEPEIESLNHRVIEPLKSKNPISSNGSITHWPNDSISEGGQMKQVKLSVQDGKVKVAHDDFADDYYADPQEIKQCLDDLGFGPPDEGETREEATGLSLAEEIRELAGLAPVDEHGQTGADPSADGERDSRATGHPATLSECVAALRRRLAGHAPAPGAEISLDQARALLSEGDAGGKFIPAADYFRWRVEQELEEAVKAGKLLPRQRDDWRKIALSDFPTFRKIIAEQKSQVPLRPVGLAGPGPEDAPTQVKLLAEQRMRERRLTFGQALSEIGREQPELVQQYRRAVTS